MEQPQEPRQKGQTGRTCGHPWMDGALSELVKCPCLWQGVGRTLSSLPTQAVLWFSDPPCLENNAIQILFQYLTEVLSAETIQEIGKKILRN